MNFDILTLSQEMRLNSAERKKYYSEIREYLNDRKFTNTTVGAITIAPTYKALCNKFIVSIFNTADGQLVI